jgi:hypothetical protein
MPGMNLTPYYYQNDVSAYFNPGYYSNNYYTSGGSGSNNFNLIGSLNI